MANKVEIIAEPGKQELFIIREFDAPRELVFKAHTDPKLYVRWLGPRELTTRMETFEARDGGSYRYISTDDAGNEYACRGVHHEVTAPERIINTFEFEGLPEKGHVILGTLRLEELPRKPHKIGVSSGLSVGRGPRRNAAIRHGPRGKRRIPTPGRNIGREIGRQ